MGVVHVPILDLDESLPGDKNPDTGGVLPAPSNDFEPALVVLNPDTGMLSNVHFRTQEQLETLRELCIQLS